LALRVAVELAMPEQTVRDQIKHAIEELPPDATFEDAIERLVFLAKIDAGLAELDAGKGVPHDEVRRRLGM
jgi:predicted transcriptional regulator